VLLTLLYGLLLSGLYRTCWHNHDLGCCCLWKYNLVLLLLLFCCHCRSTGCLLGTLPEPEDWFRKKRLVKQKLEVVVCWDISHRWLLDSFVSPATAAFYKFSFLLEVSYASLCICFLVIFSVHVSLLHPLKRWHGDTVIRPSRCFPTKFHVLLFQLHMLLSSAV